jgi:hypothetical protein
VEQVGGVGQLPGCAVVNVYPDQFKGAVLGVQQAGSNESFAIGRDGKARDA